MSSKERLTDAVSIKVPAIIATPKKTARAVSDTRTLRARSPRSVSAATVSLGLAHQLGDVLGAPHLSLVGDPAVDQGDDPMCARRHPRVVGDDDHRLAEIVHR